MDIDILSLIQQGRSAQCIGLSAVTLWTYELLNAIPEELRMFEKFSIAVEDIAYILARVMTGASMLVVAIYIGEQGASCGGLWFAAMSFGVVVIPCNSLLFLIRIKDIYHDSYIIPRVFALLWSTTFLSFMLPFTYKATLTELLLGLKVCKPDKVSPQGAAPFIALAVFDTAVVIAISARVLSHSPAKRLKDKVKLMIFARDLTRMSRSLLRSGQFYYFATVGVNVFSASVLFSSSISPAVYLTTTVFNIVFQNIMGCRVSRLLKLGEIDSRAQHATPLPLNEITSQLVTHPTYSLSRTEGVDVDSMGFTSCIERNSLSGSESPVSRLDISVTEQMDMVGEPDPGAGSQTSHHNIVTPRRFFTKR